MPSSLIVEPPVVIVVGLHRSGSTMIAGILHDLGGFIGDSFYGHDRPDIFGGGFEARGIADICEKLYPFPTIEKKESFEATCQNLSQWISWAKQKPVPYIVIKYPHLCAMKPELDHSLGADKYLVVHIDRPLSESIESINSRSQEWSTYFTSETRPPWLSTPENIIAAGTTVQTFLHHRKQEFLKDHYNLLTLQYRDLLQNPRDNIEFLINFLNISPTADQINTAISNIHPERSRHSTGFTQGEQNELII